MFANEDLVLQFIYENKEVTPLQLDHQFDDESMSMDNIISLLIRQNFVELKHDGGNNIRYVITTPGQAEAAKRQAANRRKRLMEYLDQVIHFITLPENKSTAYDEQQLSEKLNIPKEDFDAIRNFLDTRGYVQLSVTDREYIYHVKEKAYAHLLNIPEPIKIKIKPASQEIKQTINVKGHGNHIVGRDYFSLSKSRNTDASSTTPAKKNKITTGLIVRLILGILAFAVAVLKACHD